MTSVMHQDVFGVDTPAALGNKFQFRTGWVSIQNFAMLGKYARNLMYSILVNNEKETQKCSLFLFTIHQ